MLDPQARTGLEIGLGFGSSAWCYRYFRIDHHEEQTWKQYGMAMLVFAIVTTLLSYAIMRLQGHLPLNPQHFAGMAPDLAFNTAISFLNSNTNWQSYGGESDLLPLPDPDPGA